LKAVVRLADLGRDLDPLLLHLQIGLIDAELGQVARCADLAKGVDRKQHAQRRRRERPNIQLDVLLEGAARVVDRFRVRRVGHDGERGGDLKLGEEGPVGLLLAHLREEALVLLGDEQRVDLHRAVRQSLHRKDLADGFRVVDAP